MGHAALKLPTTGAEFLEWEDKQTVCHEFLGGVVVRHEFTSTEIVAMAGASEAHVTLAGNVYVAPRQHVAGSLCPTFLAGPLLKRSPLLLVEVLFIDPHTRRSGVFPRGSDRLWVLHPFDADEPVNLQSVDLTLTASAMQAEVPPADEALSVTS